MDDSKEVNDEVYNPQGWKNPPALIDLKKDFTESKNSSDTQVGLIDRWLDNMHLTGAAAVPKVKGRSSSAPKLIRKQAEWRYPALSEPFLATDDLFSLKGKTWEDVDSARQNGIVLNNQLSTQVDKLAFIDEYVRAAVDEGTAIVRVGWEVREEEVTEDVPVVSYTPDLQLVPLFEELNQLEVDNPTGYKFEVPEELRMAHERYKTSGIPFMPRVTGMEQKTTLKTVKNCPTLEICDYNNVILDPTCQGDADNAAFIIYSFETSRSDLKKEGSRYSNLDQINPENSSILGEPDHQTDNTSDFNFTDDPRKRFVAYEYWGYWDFNDTGIALPFVATWVGDVLIRMEENPYPDNKLPFVFVPLLPVKGSAYGQPDGELLEDHQKVVGALTRGMIDTMAKAANGQMGMRKDMLDATNRRKFQRGEDYEFNASVDPRQGVYVHTMNEIPASAQFLLQQQTMEAESMTGVKAFSQGINANSLGDVAAGIRGALDAASKRETSILRRLASGMKKVGRKIMAMNAEFLDEEQVIRMTNGEYVPVRRDDLAGNFDITLNISSAEEDNLKAQELAFMLQTMGNSMDAGMTKIILRDIARLRKMVELANEIENFAPEPDPLQQELQQLEMEKLRKEISLIDSQIMENFAEAELDQAKARQTESQADQQDLDYVEQESGTKQEREKELRGVQAEGNIALEQVKQQKDAGPDRESELKAFLGKNSSEN